MLRKQKMEDKINDLEHAMKAYQLTIGWNGYMLLNSNPYYVGDGLPLLVSHCSSRAMKLGLSGQIYSNYYIQLYYIII